MASNREAICAIGVMAKAPQAGRSKTRLCPPLTPDQAARLSAAFLRDTTESIARAARLAPIVPYAAYAPAGTEALLLGHVAPGTALLLADGSPIVADGVQGFGKCLLHAIQGMLAQGHTAACVLSSDSPTLPTALLADAATLLLAPGDRAVLGPADDGGYYLLGLKAAHAALFADITWSTEDVAAQTRARARSIGLELVELDSWYDVDDAASLETLLHETRGFAAPRHPWRDRTARSAPPGGPGGRLRGATLKLVFLGATLLALMLGALALEAARVPLRTEFCVGLLVLGVGVFFRATRLIMRRRLEPRGIWIVLGVAVAMRAALLMVPPYPSSDIYRCVWDGRVQAAGTNPYSYGCATAAISPHYRWYFVWLALPSVVVPIPVVIWLSAAPVILFLDPFHGRFFWPSLVYLPAVGLALADLWRHNRAPYTAIRISQGSS